jgi:hypothetical protein
MYSIWGLQGQVVWQCQRVYGAASSGAVWHAYACSTGSDLTSECYATCYANVSQKRLDVLHPCCLG